ncbi:MAG: CBS domain-containing protein [Saprospiraceae bacterium]|nr:MAG: inosine 5'-monophosphate dehydrogenase [Bacteroidetes bacterium OLB9]MCO6463835.1 CBS domain-containing protein [Saprospiraceae bacterium]MCZ2337116.1 CBS domain-containing protein [Chitinophagales bacterium]
MNTEKSIKSILTTKILAIAPDDTMLKIEEIFDTFPIHHILVTVGNELKGIISKHDVLHVYQYHADQGQVPDRSKITAGDIMTEDPITLDVDDTLGLAADIFLSNKIHSIPILNGFELAGIITNHDLMKECFK